ncbi:hypothetical protein J3R30DRAFT_1038893 [Lentinula aciculospora]|uniref:Uncharacterized protein n=1 Tax=Lentinula aciculospora TaxID=153920 RepID=A0A9W9A1D5_9AGAR|nr:hypothetical protein J3R30DRAFT_1038893 [Lentinula aciculospora]
MVNTSSTELRPRIIRGRPVINDALHIEVSKIFESFPSFLVTHLPHKLSYPPNAMITSAKTSNKRCRCRFRETDPRWRPCPAHGRSDWPILTIGEPHTHIDDRRRVVRGGLVHYALMVSPLKFPRPQYLIIMLVISRTKITSSIITRSRRDPIPLSSCRPTPIPFCLAGKLVPSFPSSRTESLRLVSTSVENTKPGPHLTGFMIHAIQSLRKYLNVQRKETPTRVPRNRAQVSLQPPAGPGNHLNLS